MRITKFTHACLLVESDTLTQRTVLFDPGVFSTFVVDSLVHIDDIFITHNHADHMDVDRIRQIQKRFPEVRITVPVDAQALLSEAGIDHGVQTTPPEGVRFFEAPHEQIRPMGNDDVPQENGIHYLELLSHPGDSHSFQETMPILALPVCAPWGSTVAAVRVALAVRPKQIIPIHDWHWHDTARRQIYERLEKRFAAEGIIFHKAVDGETINVNET